MTTPRAPTTAFILAAGYGTRLAPLSSVCPKPLMPLWNIPLLRHAVDLLSSWGVERFIVNAHHHAGQIRDFCRSLDRPACRIACSFEPEILGTGGALQHARALLPDEPFWLFNADVAAALPPDPLLRLFEQRRPLAVLWMHDRLGPRTVLMKQNEILSFHTDRPASRGTRTFCGLHLVHPDILDYIPPRGFSSIIDAYRAAQKAGGSVLGTIVPGCFWADTGTPEQYLDAHRDAQAAAQRGLPGAALYRGAAQVPHACFVPAGCFAAAGDNCRIGLGTHLCDTVLWDSVRLPARSRISRSICAAGTHVYRPLQADGSLFLPPEAILTPPEKRLLAGEPGGLKSLTVERLPLRGSNRSFFRIHGPRRNLMLIRYDAQARPENALYASHTRWLLRQGFPVPDALHHSAAHQIFLMEDAGSLDLTAFAAEATPDETERAYQAVIRAVVLLQTRATRAARKSRRELAPPFGPDLFRWEHELFLREFLARRLRLTRNETAALQHELASLAEHLALQPWVLLHRDLQSSNILLDERHRIRIIDYQGMRMGPAAYDLASLLSDPYMALPRVRQLALLDYYNARITPWQIGRRDFYTAATQRLVQALGAYGRLSAQPATARFARHIPPALALLRQAMIHLPGLTKLPETIQRLDPECD